MKVDKCVAKVCADYSRYDSVACGGTVNVMCSNVRSAQFKAAYSVNDDYESSGVLGQVDLVRQVEKYHHRDDSQKADSNLVKFKTCIQDDNLNINTERNSESELAHMITGIRWVNMCNTGDEGCNMGNKQVTSINGSS